MKHSEEDIKWLHFIRDIEFNKVIKLMPNDKSLAILEIGSGTGHILNKLKKKYDNVVGLEVEGSSYSFNDINIRLYDGKNIPFEPNTFDVIISFHVMEHVRDFPFLMQECSRVLKDGGAMIHVIPSSTWRFLTTIFYYFGAIRFASRKFLTIFKENKKNQSFGLEESKINDVSMNIGWSKLLPSRHGEEGNVITEQWYFSKTYWIKRFNSNGFSAKSIGQGGIVYWGHDFARFSLSERFRMNLARVIGASSNTFFMINLKD